MPPLPIPDPALPAFSLTFEESRGTILFMKTFPLAFETLAEACSLVLKHLYPAASPLPSITAVSLHVRPFEGVAHTAAHIVRRAEDPMEGNHITAEIHFSSEYIASLPKRLGSDDVRLEIMGVLVHEMVHVWQCYMEDQQSDDDEPAEASEASTKTPRPPHWIVEGVADYVRFRAGYPAKHWHRGAGGRLEDGYERTGFFLDWVEEKWAGFVFALNAAPHADTVKRITGQEVETLWRSYQMELGETTLVPAGVLPMPTHAPTHP
ncbi:hypothetical protein HDU87_007128 [Geranomyces variabilis]|uniref:Uncharacterized protein n=1 Tax=Geranomyces variabilis TaxID=109894 RepID=A0AAD5XQ33_9FUNG|nr:hypothetical protein HDU87_007128 [Geranomyces variabilis]